MSRSKQGSQKQFAQNPNASDLSQLFQRSLEAHRKLYETWLEATRDSLEKLQGAVAPAKAEPPPLSYEGLYDLWINAYAKLFTEAMNTPLFAATIGQYLDTMLEIKKGLNHSTGKTLKALGLPTRGDLDEIYERLIAIDRRLQELTKQVKGLAQKIKNLRE